LKVVFCRREVAGFHRRITSVELCVGLAKCRLVVVGRLRSRAKSWQKQQKR
jgi:hypothetical protein